MRKISVILLMLFLVISCDDGDVININLEFDQELELCDNFIDSYVVYDTRTDPTESLILVFPKTANDTLIFNPEESPYQRAFDIDNSSVLFNYRVYDQLPSFCSTIQDANSTILQNYIAQNGATVNAITTFVDSDDDGIPNEDEDDNADGDNNYLTNPLDTDGDGLPNYIDQDDDNDNVLTIDEDDKVDGDGNPFTNFRDTDGDGIPDYLEEDDDDDEILTRYEDESLNRNPEDDFLIQGDDLPRYRNPDAAQDFGPSSPEFRIVTYNRNWTTIFTIEDLDLEILTDDLFDFGTYTRESDAIEYDNNPD